MWTIEREARCAELWATGLSARAVAVELGGVTRNAVIGKVHRLNLPTRNRQDRKTRTPRPKRDPRIRRAPRRAHSPVSTTRRARHSSQIALWGTRIEPSKNELYAILADAWRNTAALPI